MARYRYRHDVIETAVENGTNSRPNRFPVCAWNPRNGSCDEASHQKSHESDDHNSIVHFECDCPYGPYPYPADPPTLLPNWLGEFWQHGACQWESTRLVDLSWPGTHDTLTYDLSLTVSDDGLDRWHWLSSFLHYLPPGELEDFMRIHAKTQQLTLSQQLDNGIRFLDLRIMYEKKITESVGTWYSIHGLQSKHPIVHYWDELRRWLDNHPREIVLVSLSRHGNPQATGEDQYPHVTIAEKRKLWKTYLKVFDGLMVDTRIFSNPLNATSIAELLDNNMRVVTFVADYESMTGASPLALDSAVTIQNTYDGDGGMFRKTATLEEHCQYFRTVAQRNQKVARKGGWTLLGLNTATQTWPLLVSAEERFRGWSFDARKCRVDGTQDWCPESVLDMAQLASYYNQIVLAGAGNPTSYPHAIYLDALDYNGTIRTGSQLLDGTQRGPHSSTQRFAYVDTLLEYNFRQSQCQKPLPASIQERLELYPARFWDENERGRTSIVPQCTVDQVS